jgi:hypothetical protein
MGGVGGLDGVEISGGGGECEWPWEWPCSFGVDPMGYNQITRSEELTMEEK